MTESEAVVVGGGIVGTAVAYHLASTGVGTLLIDRGDAGRATDAGAGIINPPTSSRAGSSTWLRFGREAAAYYPRVAAELEAAGHRHGYARPGLLFVPVDPDDHEHAEAAKRRVSAVDERERAPDRDRESGRAADHDVRTLDPEQARKRFPPLQATDGVLWFPDAGRVDGATFTRALRETGRQAGLAVKSADVTGVCVDDGTVTGVETAAGSIDAGTVVIAGGAWSATFEADLDLTIPVEPQRGQILHAAVEEETDDWAMVGTAGYGYLVPWPDGRVACGATREDGSGFAPMVTLDGLRTLTARALTVAPGLADARHLETHVGLRPVSADGLPILGAVPSVEGAYVATGHGATGLQLGPLSGAIIADLVVGETPPVDIGPFRPDRFAE